MKSFMLISSLLLMTSFSVAQDAKTLLIKSREKCQSITNGYYEMTTQKKSMSRPDTSAWVNHAHFKKTSEDLPFPSLFHIQSFYEGNPTWQAVFTGKEFVTFSVKDSSGTIMNVDTWAEEIEERAHNYDFYDPFTSKESSPLPDDSTFLDPTYRVIFHGEEIVGDKVCFHIESHELPDSEGEPFEFLDYVLHFWINKADMVLVQYSSTFSLVMAKDTMVQYDLITLNRYEVNKHVDEDKFSMKVLPPYAMLKDYTPYQAPDPLPVDTIAPSWSFPNLKDEMVSLESLKGQLVLIDFFYKSCIPCMQALPALQSLHEKYKNKGLVVIGLDPYDDKEDNLPTFLSKRNVDYTVLYASKEIAKTYRVSGYPTMFLLDKEGRIIFVQVGYGVGVETKLEELILKNL